MIWKWLDWIWIVKVCLLLNLIVLIPFWLPVLKYILIKIQIYLLVFFVDIIRNIVDLLKNLIWKAFCFRIELILNFVIGITLYLIKIFRLLFTTLYTVFKDKILEIIEIIETIKNIIILIGNYLIKILFIIIPNGVNWNNIIDIINNNRNNNDNNNRNNDNWISIFNDYSFNNENNIINIRIDRNINSDNLNSRNNSDGNNNIKEVEVTISINLDRNTENNTEESILNKRVRKVIGRRNNLIKNILQIPGIDVRIQTERFIENNITQTDVKLIGNNSAQTEGELLEIGKTFRISSIEKKFKNNEIQTNKTIDGKLIKIKINIFNEIISTLKNDYEYNSMKNNLNRNPYIDFNKDYFDKKIDKRKEHKKGGSLEAVIENGILRKLNLNRYIKFTDNFDIIRTEKPASRKSKSYHYDNKDKINKWINKERVLSTTEKIRNIRKENKFRVKPRYHVINFMNLKAKNILNYTTFRINYKPLEFNKDNFKIRNIEINEYKIKIEAVITKKNENIKKTIKNNNINTIKNIKKLFSILKSK